MESALRTATGQRLRPRALDAASMCEAFQLTAAERPDQLALRTFQDRQSFTFAQYADWVRRLAGGLHSLGVRRGDPVALMLTNRPEFDLLDTAAMHLGACPFSIYNTSSVKQIAYLLNNAGCRVVAVQASFEDQMRSAVAQAGQVEHLIVIDAAPPDAVTLEQLGEADPGEGFDFEASWRAVGPEDLLTLIYTSGTT